MVKFPKPPRAGKNPELCCPSEFLTSVYFLENFPVSSSFSLPYCSQVLHRSWTMHGLLRASGLPFPRSPALRSSLLLSAQFCEQILWRTTLRPGLMSDIQVTPSSQQPFTQSLFKEEITSLIEKETANPWRKLLYRSQGDCEFLKEQGSRQGAEETALLLHACSHSHHCLEYRAKDCDSPTHHIFLDSHWEEQWWTENLETIWWPWQHGDLWTENCHLHTASVCPFLPPVPLAEHLVHTCCSMTTPPSPTQGWRVLFTVWQWEEQLYFLPKRTPDEVPKWELRYTSSDSNYYAWAQPVLITEVILVEHLTVP